MRQYRYSRALNCKKCKNGLRKLEDYDVLPTSLPAWPPDGWKFEDLCSCIREQIHDPIGCTIFWEDNEPHVTEWL
jgi:hypothetical protein